MSEELPMVVVPPPAAPVVVSRPIKEIAKDLGLGKLSAAKVKALRDFNVAVEEIGTANVVGGYILVSQQCIIDTMIALRKAGEKDTETLLKTAHPLGYLANALAKSAETSKKVSAIKKAHDLDDGNRNQARVRRKQLPSGVQPIQHIQTQNVIVQQAKNAIDVESDIEEF